MNTWTGRVVISNEPGGNRDDWYVEERLCYFDKESNWAITVLPGARTDGASIPRFFWRIVGGPFSGRYIAAALIHDQLYKAQGSGLMHRKEVDNIFKRAMLSCGVSQWKAKVMYRAVRMGGNWPIKAWEELQHQQAFLQIESVEDYDG